MKSILSFSGVIFLIVNSFSQSNYAVWGDDDFLRSDGIILRIEVRDRDSRVPISDATIEISGSNNREIAYLRTNHRGIGVLILKRVNSQHPYNYLVRITKEGYKYYETSIERDYLKSEKVNNMILLPQLPELISERNPLSRFITNWSGAPLPRDSEIVKDVISKNYDIFVTYSNEVLSAPGIFEYSIALERIHGNVYQLDHNQGENINRQNNDNRNINIANNARSWHQIPVDPGMGGDNVLYSNGISHLLITGAIDEYNVVVFDLDSNGEELDPHEIDRQGNRVDYSIYYSKKVALEVAKKYMENH